ncbi:Cysteine desulfurase [Cedecea neteri]|uniref:Cysteine desulfurase n=1 Tax=Cedecea neteri TaxID=158822 RepID=A0A2X3JDG7_9ENTR|nr:Cysteine desulfurase [Cedecea neteri]
MGAIGEYERNLMRYAQHALQAVPELTVYGPEERRGVLAFNLGKPPCL